MSNQWFDIFYNIIVVLAGIMVIGSLGYFDQKIKELEKFNEDLRISISSNFLLIENIYYMLLQIVKAKKEKKEVSDEELDKMLVALDRNLNSMESLVEKVNEEILDKLNK